MSMATAVLHALRQHLCKPSLLHKDQDINRSEHGDSTAAALCSLLTSRCCPSLACAAMRRCSQILMLEGDSKNLHTVEACVDGCEVVGLLSVAAGAMNAMLAPSHDSFDSSLAHVPQVV